MKLIAPILWATLGGFVVPAWVPAVPQSASAALVNLEYIGHAAFVIESPAGTRIVIDPFNGNIWLGYSFPHGIEADAVLVTHPHYDHDATYYFSDLTPVFRSPGEFRVGDVSVRGVKSEHAGRARFLDVGQTPFNTIWEVEVGGLRITHLGDNRLLNEVDLEAMEQADVILINVAYFDAPNLDMLTMLLETIQPDIMVPMHYRHKEISELPRGMRSIANYMEAYDPLYVEGSVAALDPDNLSEWSGLVVLKPSPELEPWSDDLQKAWIEANEGAGKLSDSENETDNARAEEVLWEGLFHYESAMDLAPEVLRFGYGAGRALAALGQGNEAIETLEHALARAPHADWTGRSRAHMLLGELYESSGLPGVATAHYAYVVAQEHTHETLLRERALQRLEELRQR